jgi:hypothetical protein
MLALHPDRINRGGSALGCADWYTARVTTCAELDHAMKERW